MRNGVETLESLIQAEGQGLKRTAEAASIGRTSIWRWSRGVTSPRHAQASALAAALGVPVDRVLAAVSASRRRAQRKARALAR